MTELKLNTETKLVDLQDAKEYIVEDSLGEVQLEKRGDLLYTIQGTPNSYRKLSQTYNLKELVTYLVSTGKIAETTYEELQLKDIPALNEIVYSIGGSEKPIPKELNQIVFPSRYLNFITKGDLREDPNSPTFLAYKVLLKNEKHGLYTSHIMAKSEDVLRKIVEAYHPNEEIISFKPKEMTSHTFMLKDMIEGKEYEALAESDQTNDTIAFRKEGNWIYTEIRGGEFTEVHKHKYKLLDIIEPLVKNDHITKKSFEEMDIAYLMWVDFEVYCNVVAYQKMPEEYVGLAYGKW